MKILKSAVSLFLLMGLAFQTPAGTISGGGGGTTNPNPANPEWIVSAVFFDAGQILTTWFQKQEMFFFNLSSEEKEKSPFRKIFLSNKSIYHLLKTIEIDLEMNRPCFDREGNERDGSVYGSNPGSICISPFTMAPKLNQYNAKEETLALIVHELSHLFEASEEEAVEIQTQAVWNFYKTNFQELQLDISILSNSHNFGSELTYLMTRINMSSEYPQELDMSEFVSINETLLKLRGLFDRPLGNFLLLPVSLYKVLTPQFVRTGVLQSYVCAYNSHQHPEVKKDCQNELIKGFQDDDQVTAREYLLRRDGIDFGPGYDSVTIAKLENWDSVSTELQKFQDFLRKVLNEMSELEKFRMKINRKGMRYFF